MSVTTTNDKLYARSQQVREDRGPNVIKGCVEEAISILEEASDRGATMSAMSVPLEDFLYIPNIIAALALDHGIKAEEDIRTKGIILLSLTPPPST